MVGRVVGDKMVDGVVMLQGLVLAESLQQKYIENKILHVLLYITRVKNMELRIYHS